MTPVPQPRSSARPSGRSGARSSSRPLRSSWKASAQAHWERRRYMCATCRCISTCWRVCSVRPLMCGQSRKPGAGRPPREGPSVGPRVADDERMPAGSVARRVLLALALLVPLSVDPFGADTQGMKAELLALCGGLLLLLDARDRLARRPVAPLDAPELLLVALLA